MSWLKDAVSSENTEDHVDHCAPGGESAGDVRSIDFLLWVSLVAIIFFYLTNWLFADAIADWPFLSRWSAAIRIFVDTIWWGIALGMVMVALLSKVPRDFVVAVVGRDAGLSGIIRATLGGVLLDLCSHGILMIAAKLYERGVSAGQVVAFLVASPWNSFSLTLLLVALIGLEWTLLFIALSLLIAIICGLIFNVCVDRGILPENPNRVSLPEGFRFWPQAIIGLRSISLNGPFMRSLVVDGLTSTRPVLRWILFGIVLAALVRASIDTGSFQTYFGPTIAGLGLTIVVATVLEICSEGSAPIGADLVTRAGAPGNGFAFLMTGVATDYTEIMVLKETTRSWRFALFLPLICVPQVLIVAVLLNLA